MPHHANAVRGASRLGSFWQSSGSTPDDILSVRGGAPRRPAYQHSPSQDGSSTNPSLDRGSAAPPGDTSGQGERTGATTPGRELRVFGIKIWSSRPPREADPDPDRRYGWNKDAMPGGHRLWCRLVVGFSLLAALGVVFITLGSVFFRKSYELAMEEDLSIPMVWCVIGIVCGVLFICGSIILGKIMNSSRWRKNQQPNYRNLAVATARYVARPVATDGVHDPEAATVEIQFPFPPSYEEAARTANPGGMPPAIFILSTGDVTINTHGALPSDAPALSPPSYSETSPSPPSYCDSQPPGGDAVTAVAAGELQRETGAAQGPQPSQVGSRQDEAGLGRQSGAGGMPRMLHDGTAPESGVGMEIAVSGGEASPVPPPYSSRDTLRNPESCFGVTRSGEADGVVSHNRL